jgi:hypothetical protein
MRRLGRYGRIMAMARYDDDGKVVLGDRGWRR